MTGASVTRVSVNDKLSRYLLDESHPIGKHKAEWFKQALGFTKDNMDDLAKQIDFDPLKAFPTELTEYGQKYNQIIKIIGANGKEIDVMFVWIKKNDGIPCLVTAFPR